MHAQDTPYHNQPSIILPSWQTYLVMTWHFYLFHMAKRFAIHTGNNICGGGNEKSYNTYKRLIMSPHPPRLDLCPSPSLCLSWTACLSVWHNKTSPINYRPTFYFRGYQSAYFSALPRDSRFKTVVICYAIKRANKSLSGTFRRLNIHGLEPQYNVY